MRQKTGLFARLWQRLDLPREALPYGFGLSMSGQNELTVRGCRRILQYGDREICLSLGKAVLHIRGEGLVCTVFLENSVTVRGCIASLSFGGESRAD